MADSVNCGSDMSLSEITNYEIPTVSSDKMERAVTVAKYLMSKDSAIKPIHAAAIVGTFLDENGCDPRNCMKAEKDGKGAKGTGGFGYGAGISSWTGVETKNNALASIGIAPNTPIESLSLQQQSQMVVNDINGQWKKYYDAVKRCTTIEEASAAHVCLIGGVGKIDQSHWKAPNHPTAEDAMYISNWYGESNDRRFGKSPYHWNLYPRRLANAKQVLSKLGS